MPASGSPSPSALPRVLVVDGDADTRELYRDSFSISGWSMIEAADGREGLVQALVAKPSVVLSELRLPLIDGIALCELLRRDQLTATVPILIVTSETRATELARAQRAGADAVLIKPSTPDIVMAEMLRLVRSAGAATARAASLPRPSPAGRRPALVKAYRRLATTTPDNPPASLNCPICTYQLKYQETFIGGVSSRHPERWDYYQCGRCGRFQYRYRTRKLRQIS